MTLFLDFDGVFHPDPCAEEVRFCRRNLVQNFLREFPQVDIVLSTTWRLRDFAERIVGVTPNHKDLDRSQALALRTPLSLPYRSAHPATLEMKL